VLREHFDSDIYSLFAQIFRWFTLSDWDLFDDLAVWARGSGLFLYELLFIGLYLRLGVIFLILFVFGADVEKGEGGVETIALTGCDEVICVEIVGVTATGGCVEVEFGELQFAIDRVARLHVCGGAVDGLHFLKELLDLIDGEITLIGLEFIREGSIEIVAYLFFAGQVLIEKEVEGVV
jgi:hypothetical protein